MAEKGHVFWLFGLSGAGKSTLADLLSEDLRARGIAVLRLDGDMLRGGLCAGLGFSDSDRAENLRRAAEVARLGAASGLVVVASFITPGESHRRLVRQTIGEDKMSVIFLSASLDVCRQRDVKGLYARASGGKVLSMTGVSAPFEAPTTVNLVLATDREAVSDSARTLYAHARTRLNLV